MEAVRGYLRELRLGRAVSQDQLADAIGLSRKALIDWEMGRTEDIKTGVMLRAIRYLRGAVEDLGNLIDASIDEGIALAQRRLKQKDAQHPEAGMLSAEEMEQVHQIAKAIPNENRQDMLELLETMGENPSKLQQWLGYGARITEELTTSSSGDQPPQNTRNRS